MKRALFAGILLSVAPPLLTAQQSTMSVTSRHSDSVVVARNGPLWIDPARVRPTGHDSAGITHHKTRDGAIIGAVIGAVAGGIGASFMSTGCLVSSADSCTKQSTIGGGFVAYGVAAGTIVGATVGKIWSLFADRNQRIAPSRSRSHQLPALFAHERTIPLPATMVELVAELP